MVKAERAKENLPHKQTAGYSMSVPVDLSAVLTARDRRAVKRRDLLAEGGACLLSVTLLMPGTIKTTRLSRAFLREYCSYLRRQMDGQAFSICREEAVADSAGDVYFFVFSSDTDPFSLKKFTILMEEEFDWSRVLDLDIYLPDHQQVSRTALKLPERRCLICAEDAHACSRSRRHSSVDLQKKVRQFQTEGLLQMLPERMQATSISAALSELLTAPKPGLVTGADAGSHVDMDRFTYADSIAALAGYFHAAATCGLTEALRRSSGSEDGGEEAVSADFLKIVSDLHRHGLRAERQMFAATKGVNTQKGFVYLGGIVLAAAAALSLDQQLFAVRFENESESDVIRLWQKEISRWTKALHEVQTASPTKKETAGESIKRLYGISGVRGEAAAGLENVFQLALPFYRGLRRRELAKNEASAVTLLLLLAATDDTTLIKRAGMQQAQLIRQELADFFNSMSQTEGRCPKELLINSVGTDRIADSFELTAANVLSASCLDNIVTREAAVISYISLWSDYFKNKGYSAGGAADLLAICFLVLQLLADI